MKKTVLILLLALLLILSACAKEDENGTASEDLPVGGEFRTGADGNGKIPSYTAVDDAAAKAALEALDIKDTQDKTIKEGITLKTLSLGSGGKAYILTVSLDKYTLSASTPFDQRPFGTNQPLSSQAQILEKGGKTVLGGISANPMNLSINEPVGIVIKDGGMVYDRGFDDGSVFFGIYEDGKAFAGSNSEYEAIYRNKTDTVVSGTQMLIINGKRQTLYGDDGVVINRIGAGFTADRGTAVLVYGEGVDMETLTSLLLGSKCSVAVSLISGDLACMTANGENFGTRAPVGPALFVTEKNG